MNITEFEEQAWHCFLSEIAGKLLHLSIDNTVTMITRNGRSVPIDYCQLFQFCGQLEELRLSLFEKYRETSELLQFEFESLLWVAPILFYLKFIPIQLNIPFATKAYNTLSFLLRYLNRRIEFLRIKYPSEEGFFSLPALDLLREFSILRGLNLNIIHLKENVSQHMHNLYYNSHKKLFLKQDKLETLTIYFEKHIDSIRLFKLFAMSTPSKGTLTRLRLENPVLNAEAFRAIYKNLVNIQCLQLINCSFVNKEEIDDIIISMALMSNLTDIIIERDELVTNEGNAPYIYFDKYDFIQIILHCKRLRYIRISPCLSEEDRTELRQIALDKGLEDNNIRIYLSSN